MSRRVSLIITDDFDGSENARTVSFGLDGVSYEIDLSDENKAKLEQALAPFIGAARRVPRDRRRRQPAQSAGQKGFEHIKLDVVSEPRVSVDPSEWHFDSVQVAERPGFGLSGDERGD